VVLLVNDTRGSRVQVVGSRRTLLLVVVMMVFGHGVVTSHLPMRRHCEYEQLE
jgi:hypothetical protein